MKQWRCEDGHIITCEGLPRACTHGKLGFVMRTSDALVVPPTCGKPLRPYLAGTARTPPLIGGQPQIIGMAVGCYGCGKLTANTWYCDDCWGDL